MNKLLPVRKKLSVLLLCIMALAGIGGCAYFYSVDALSSADEAENAARCAEKEADLRTQAANLDPSGQAAKDPKLAKIKDAAQIARDSAKAAADANSKAQSAFTSFSGSMLDVPDDLVQATQQAEINTTNAVLAAAGVPGCGPKLAKRPPDGKYNQDIFGSQKLVGPHS